MPHAAMKLIPGIDTTKTPALNEASFSTSQLVRFVPDKGGMGIIQKMGGWVSWYGTGGGQPPIPNITELHAWEDLNNNTRLAVGANSSLSYIDETTRNRTVITPQVAANNLDINPSATATITIASPAVITTAVAPPEGTPVVFTTTGALPTGLTAGTIYYVAASPAPTLTTFSVAATPSGVAINTSGTQSGIHTVIIPTVSTTSGSTTVTIVDTTLGAQSSVSFSNGSPTIVTATSTPVQNSTVVFYGGSLPTGVTQGTVYYVQPINSTAFNITTLPNTLPASYVNTSSTGTGDMYAPNQIKKDFSVYIETPISISNLILSGVYQVSSAQSNNYYNIYTIEAATKASSTSYQATIPLFTPATNLSTVTVTQANHNLQTGAFQTFLISTTSSGVTIYGSYQITYISSTQYSIFASSAASGSTPFYMNYGATVNDPRIALQYYYNIPAGAIPSGFGTGGFGVGGFGTGLLQSYSGAPTITTNDWTINNFGQILIASPENGPIYYWDPSVYSQTAFLLNTAPMANLGFFIAMPERQIVTYGTTTTGIQDPLLIRYCQPNDATVWQGSPNNLAGSYRIPEGSRIVGAWQAPQQAFIWTDVSMWAMQWVGAPDSYQFTKVSDGVGLIAKKAVGSLNNNIYWMSSQNFYVYTSNGPTSLTCPVWDNVFQNLNTNYLPSIRCATNTVFNEIIWYYPSVNSLSGVNDSYVKYNTATQSWDYGLLDRTAWIDQSVIGTPVGSGSNGVIYQHEIGYNNDTSPMVSSFTTGYMQLNDADSMVFIDQIWPNFKYVTSGGGTGGSTTPATLYVTFYGVNYPSDTPTVYGPYTVTSTTEYISTRIRNRLLAIGISTSPDGSTSQLNEFFRIGQLRYRYQTDGKF